MSEFVNPLTTEDRIQIVINFLNDLNSDLERMNAYQIKKIRYMIRKEKWSSSQAMHQVGFAMIVIQVAIEELKKMVKMNEDKENNA